MKTSNSGSHGKFCSKATILRLLLVASICLVTYLCIYKANINLIPLFGRSILTPLVTVDGSDGKNLAKTATPASSSTASSSASTTMATTAPKKVVDAANQSTNDQPKEAFVTFSNNNPTYLALLKILLDSVHAFSTRPIIAFGIDVDLDVDVKQYPRLIKRRIKQSDCGPSVFFCKIHAILSSNVDYGVLMETDDVVNYNVDVLFDIVHVWPYPLPISPRHPDDPNNYHHFMNEHNVSKKTTPYIHAHIIWNYRAKPFFENLHSLLKQGHFQGSNFDESAVNVMLWKAGANHTACKYDPYFTFSDAYERWPNITNCEKYCHTAFITLHGCKEDQVSAALLTRLKANAGKPTTQLLGMGGFRYTNDTNATCCYPDSKPSPIHPLLCEHPPPA